MRCAHCYDAAASTEDAPGRRPALRLPQALPILDGLRDFCARRGIPGQVAWTGGDPLLHPDFLDLHAAAAARGLDVAILGNPAPRERVEAIVAIRRPRVWQVSLEGLPATHDAVRGPGSHARALEFLRLLKALGVRAHVMVTLTAANLDEVLPLAASLGGLFDRLAFSRLVRTGRGAALEGAAPAAYAAFARRYVAAAQRDHRLSLKDGLLNLALAEAGLPPAGGCTGAGCGAAFNFLAVLPDGEAHACRKLPSPVGHLLRQPLEAVWGSPAAARWREGTLGCRGCAHRARCGGCPAVAHGEGLDPLLHRDPACPGPAAAAPLQRLVGLGRGAAAALRRAARAAAG
jgi:selenobiotic family peptide radical SAM maturase